MPDYDIAKQKLDQQRDSLLDKENARHKAAMADDSFGLKTIFEVTVAGLAGFLLLSIILANR
jgi:hypothetical protein